MGEDIYTNYRLVLGDCEMAGTLVAREGRIVDIQPGASAYGIDGRNEYLFSGLIELHTDTLESCAMPRIGVHWPLELAVVQQDRMLISSGITTAYNALAVREIPNAPPAADRIRALFASLDDARSNGRLLADHHLHLRCEATCASAPAVVRDHADDHSIVSLMDHRPGQRQFLSRAKLYDFYLSKYGLTPQEIDSFLAQCTLDEAEVAANRTEIARTAREAGAVLASHDDATLEHVQEAADAGATISEFPTTELAADAAASKGLRVLMGAPNLLLGRSHSGNLSTFDVARQGRLHILSSDYAPHSLLPAIFRLARLTGAPLYASARLATKNPADALRLDDVGELAPGKRANFLTCRFDGVAPLITSVVVGGRRVA